ncbi:flagellar basal-body rod protein FlgG [Ruminiclostridium sufflavum DSM 19573]|uniref:Flagellar basal-body rod protein FlgG n=1 Tax=Ruminiclostridium sufflavum DSM 19573 TaxID=1121337 RepID=A0A318XL87_9FIRM|nr:flagellar hook-basal body protein [Ruminiclostridium sufflavum]PYG88278.1 flagellar basal-body rod protein FlgG [Ruminiclostridium sufflavum DSM 19573]
MIRGLYTSGWSMLANTRKLDVITNNMANVNTTAYKKDTVVFESFPSVLTKRINDTRSPLNPSGNIGSMQLSSDVGEVYTYYTQGQLAQTGSKLDFAIKDDGSNIDTSPAFFTIGVMDEGGNNNSINEYYTKDGSFTINANNQLVTKEGYFVLGEKGPVTLSSAEFTVNEKGEILQNGEIVDKLRIAQFSDAAKLRKFGNNLIQNTDSEAVDFTGSVVQGYTEQSNVNVVDEMVDMITVMRAYEASQKVLQAQDSSLEKTVTEVGVVR